MHHFPKYNLIIDQENEELYFEKLSDELIRYEKIRKYIFLKNKYMNFDIVNYKISNSEILIMESTLLNILDKWRNDELMTTINYIKYKNIFDKITKDDVLKDCIKSWSDKRYITITGVDTNKTMKLKMKE